MLEGLFVISHSKTTVTAGIKIFCPTSKKFTKYSVKAAVQKTKTKQEGNVGSLLPVPV